MRPVPIGKRYREKYYTMFTHEHDLMTSDDPTIRKLGREAIEAKTKALCLRDECDLHVCTPAERAGYKIAKVDWDRGEANFYWYDSETEPDEV